MTKPKILVTGANGQIGQVLTLALRKKYGWNNVLATDIQKQPIENEPYDFLDILNETRMQEIIEDQGITQVYHLAALLSASGEINPVKTWNINLNGFMSVMDLCVNLGIEKLFYPSTIAVFGRTTPKINTPQHCSLVPETVYGISKVSGELLANYFNKRYDLDVRSIRYPGIISHQSLPSGGTTDYAVEIFYHAKKHGKYECFLGPDTRLPMMYIDDAIKATLDLMDADSKSITQRTSYNVSAMSFTPAEIATEIKKHIPNFEIIYKPDFRQAIADSWTESIDDSFARKDWNWNESYNLSKMTEVMLKHVDINMID
jgi:nucleoside-diphosphate-sugar epimerase